MLGTARDLLFEPSDDRITVGPGMKGFKHQRGQGAPRFMTDEWGQANESEMDSTVPAETARGSRAATRARLRGQNVRGWVWSGAFGDFRQWGDFGGQGAGFGAIGLRGGAEVGVA